MLLIFSPSGASILVSSDSLLKQVFQSVSVIISDNLVKDKQLNAGSIIKELAKEINGGGGGQAFYATAGGTKNEGLSLAIQKAKLLFN